MRIALVDWRWPVIVLAAVLAAGCGSVSGDDDEDPGKLDCTASGVSDGQVIVSGTATFDSVPHNPEPNGLNYSAITQKPIRGVTVQAVCETTVYATTKTDAAGSYSITVPNKTTMLIRIQARMRQDDTASWDFQVVDNTSGQALYALDSEPFDSGTADLVLDLNAASGWTGSGYGETRAAAPFAILDAVYIAYNKVLAVDNDVQFEPLLLNWSPNNKPSDGNLSDGDIGTTYYGEDKIYILGAAGTDTDEYDDHVIIHEWGHYLEDNLSRSDSIGGPHSNGDQLDLRTAYGEGFGNAWSGMATDDPLYQDSFGNLQSSSFDIDVENDNDPVLEGWYSETSIQAILYDIYDSASDATDGDTLALGLAPLYTVWTGDQATTPALTSIFSFTKELREELGTTEQAGLDAILVNHDIVGGAGLDIYGSNETNNGAEPGNDFQEDVLPIYTEIFPPGPNLANLCSVNDYDEYNKLSNWRFLRFNIAAAGDYTITVTGGTDPDFWLYHNGAVTRAESDSSTTGTEILTESLASGDYVLAITDFVNVDLDTATGGRSCLTVSITQ